jgi:hypothetical protein
MTQLPERRDGALDVVNNSIINEPLKNLAGRTHACAIDIAAAWKKHRRFRLLFEF